LQTLAYRFRGRGSAPRVSGPFAAGHGHWQAGVTTVTCSL
jgi:hypothetical protein